MECWSAGFQTQHSVMSYGLALERIRNIELADIFDGAAGLAA